MVFTILRHFSDFFSYARRFSVENFYGDFVKTGIKLRKNVKKTNKIRAFKVLPQPSNLQSLTGSSGL